MKSMNKVKVEEPYREVDSLKMDRLQLEQRLKWVEESLKQLQDERDELLPRIEHKKKEESEKQARASELIFRNEQKITTGQVQKSPPTLINRVNSNTKTLNEQYPDALTTGGSCNKERCNCRLFTTALESTQPRKPYITANRTLLELPLSYIEYDTSITAADLELDCEKPQFEVTSRILDSRPKKSLTTEAPEKSCSTAISVQSQRGLSILDRLGLSEKNSSGAQIPTDIPQTGYDPLPSSSFHCSEWSDHSSIEEFCGPMPASMEKPYDVNDCVSEVCGYVPSKAKRSQSNATVSKKNGW
jgi:hypothetical protein